MPLCEAFLFYHDPANRRLCFLANSPPRADYRRGARTRGAVGLCGRDVADCQIEAMVMDDDVYVIDMPDALTTIRRVAALIEEIGAYCPRCGGVLNDGARHECDLITAVEDESGVTASVRGDDLQAPDSPFVNSPRRA